MIAPTSSRHKCMIYEGHPSEQLPVIVPLMADSLAENRRCLYLGDPSMIDMVETALGRAGVDIGRETKRGALVFSSDRKHLDDGGFDPKAMVGLLRQLVDQSVRDGFQGLCAAGDMMWELGHERNFDRLLEYEALLDQVFGELPLKGVCLYHRGIVPPRALRDAMLTHPAFYVQHELYKDNLFYVPPDLLVEDPGSAVRDRQGEWMWQQIHRIMTAERERDRALAELGKANEELERRVQERTSALESFSYSVSHDLRAPLRAIGGFTRLILERDGPHLGPEARQDFDRVLRGVEHMSKLIDALLHLAKVSRGDLRTQSVDLGELAGSIAASLGADSKRAVRLEIAQNLIASADPALLSVALENLLSNAWKFTAGRNPAVIQVGKLEKEGETVFFVKDNGAGFDMKFADRLFSPFQRLHSQTEFPGIGIGLATVQRIIHRHGGRVWAESTPGAGATIFFTLPSDSKTPSAI